MTELHIMLTLREDTDPEQVANIILRPTFPDADGPGILHHDETVEWHTHDHEDGPGGEIVGWDVLVVTSHTSHNAATLHAEIERKRDPHADVEIQPVIGNPPGEQEEAA